MFRRNKHIVMLISSFGFLILKGLPCSQTHKVTNSSDFSVNLFENSWWMYIHHLHLISIVYSKKRFVLDFFMSYKIPFTNCLFSSNKNSYFWVTIDRAHFLYSFWSACSSVQHSFFEMCISPQIHLLKTVGNLFGKFFRSFRQSS